MTSFADITTMGVGGPIAHFIEPTTRVGLIEAVEEADSKGLPLVVVGGGSNLLVSDKPFDGVVVRDARRLITVPDEAAPVEGEDRTVHVNAEAGANWDDFVAFTVELGLEGVEGLSGIPGTVGGGVLMNAGAYGAELSQVVAQVEGIHLADGRRVSYPADRLSFSPADLRFGYRYSALKTSMYAGPGRPAGRFFPTPRYVVLSVTFALTHSAEGTVGYGQLAKALGVEVGDRMATADIRKAVLAVRAAKGMLEDPTRYALPDMATAKREANILTDLERLASLNEAAGIPVGDDGLPAPDYNRHSCGSFFMNPILTADQAAALPEDAPKFDATLPDGTPGTKTSAAWLIDHAGCHKGYKVDADAPASLSTQHTLALTNRGGASAADIAALARAVQQAVKSAFGVDLVPEPVCVGVL